MGSSADISREDRDAPALTCGREGGRGHPSRIGFTLVELLVVLAIVSALIALLVPSLSLARAQAREVSCRSNLHQIHLAMEGYASVNKGWYPLEPTEINPHRKLMNNLRAEKNGLVAALYCPQSYAVEDVAQNTTDYLPIGLGTSIIDTPDNRAAGNITFLYWSFQDRSQWRATSPKYKDPKDDSFRPRWLRNSGLPIPFQPSQPNTPCKSVDPPCPLQKERKGDYWVLSDFFRQGAPFPHYRPHKSGLNVLYLDGHGEWMFGQPRANFK